MAYNHEETKVRDPSAAKEVERLRDDNSYILELLEHALELLEFEDLGAHSQQELQKIEMAYSDYVRTP